MNSQHQGFRKLSCDRRTDRHDRRTHEVDISEDGWASLADRSGAVVRDESVDVVEVRSVVPQIVLVSVRRPQDAEMLHFAADP